jgi:hypothetical protein
MKYEVLQKKGQKVIMPIRYSVRNAPEQQSSCMDKSFHTGEALGGVSSHKD